MRKVRTLASLSALLAVVLPTAAHSAPTTTTYYFHSATYTGNVDQAARAAVGIDGPWMDAVAPEAPAPSIAEQNLTGVYPKAGPYGVAWVGEVTGAITGDATVKFWAITGSTTTIHVRLFADEGAAEPAPVAEAVVAGVRSATPVAYTATFTGLNVPVDHELIVQFSPQNSFVNGAGEFQMLYDSPDYPSGITFTYDPDAGGGGGGGEPGGGPTGTDYLSYPAPETLFGAHGPNETSLGVNPRTNAAMFQVNTTTAKVTFDDSVSPPAAAWLDTSYLLTSINTLDPYLWTDPVTGRTFVSQLAGEASINAFTDDDGATWTPTQPPSTAPSFDHESLVGGPYPADFPLAGSYEGGALYYCSQGLFVGQCTRSDDGGLTWGAPLPFSVSDQCLPSHGRIVVGPDGALYVPVRDCGAFGQGLFVSRDAGVSWTQVVVPGTKAANSDPALAIDKGGKVYYAASTDGTLKVATSTNSGASFGAPVDVAGSLGIKNTEFAMAVAGEAGRAAVAFYGSTTPGDDQDENYTGEWHLYVATTVDGGATWSTIDATGSDPVQRGYICMAGLDCAGGRNLLDFQSIAIDNTGRVLVGYADGCTTAKCIGAVGKTNEAAGSDDSLATIARQMTGARLIGPLGASTPAQLHEVRPSTVRSR